jgi:hypothetical protein
MHLGSTKNYGLYLYMYLYIYCRFLYISLCSSMFPLYYFFSFHIPLYVSILPLYRTLASISLYIALFFLYFPPYRCVYLYIGRHM